MKRSTVLTLAVIGVALLLSTGVALAESQLDTQYSDISKENSPAVIGSDYSAAAQLFSPRKTGKLDKVSVYLGQNGTGSPTGDVLASIQTVKTTVWEETGWETHEPSGTKLGEGTVSANGNVPTDGSFKWVDIPLSQPASVDAYQSLALVLETTSDPSGYKWGAGVEHTFCGASACDKSAQIRQNETWYPYSADSFFFKTCVDNGSTNTPAECDMTPPLTILDSSSGPSGTVTSDSASFAFSSSESNSTFQCRLDSTSDSGWSPCSSPKTYTGLSDGAHTFYVKAIDPAGNLATPASRTWTVDKTPPTGTVSINNGASRTNTPSVTLTLSATDPSPGSGVTQMRISNTKSGISSAPWEAYTTTKPWTLTSSKETKTVYVQYWDGAGNSSAVATDTIAYK